MFSTLSYWAAYDSIQLYLSSKSKAIHRVYEIWHKLVHLQYILRMETWETQEVYILTLFLTLLTIICCILHSKSTLGKISWGFLI
jgi:hypothetical protein